MQEDRTWRDGTGVWTLRSASFADTSSVGENSQTLTQEELDELEEQGELEELEYRLERRERKQRKARGRMPMHGKDLLRDHRGRIRGLR